MKYKLIHADVLEGLAGLPDESVQTCITSPPYFGLRDYGIEPSVWGGDAMHAHEWGDARRVRKTGGTKSSGLGSDHFANGLKPETVVEHIERSFVVSDGGSFCNCGAWRGCFGLEPTPDLYVEHAVMVFREVRRVLRDDGTLWLNLGDSYANDGKWGGSTGGKHVSSLHGSPVGRARRFTGLKSKDLVGIPWAVAFALRADGWYLRRDIVWSKLNPMPESVQDRPTTAHEYLFLFAKSETYFYDADAIAEPIAASMDRRPWLNEFRDDRPDVGGTSRSNGRRGAIAKGNAKTFRGGGAYTGNRSFDNSADVERESHGNAPNLKGTRNKRSVWTIATQPFPEAHFATFPEEIPRTCILAGSRIGDVVLDPFSGAATTGVAALSTGREYIGIERSAQYVEMSRRRLAKIDAWQPSLLPPAASLATIGETTARLGLPLSPGTEQGGKE